jgi:hypothetical protein
MPVRVAELEFDEWNEAEFERHGVREREIRQVLDDAPAFFRNKRPHTAQLVMIGPTLGGRLLTVPLAPTARDGVWRPATAWDSSDGERARYHASRGRPPPR